MRRVRSGFIHISFIAALLCVPDMALAQLSSENYRVEGYAIGSAGQSADATSTNYGLDQESGGLYEYGDPESVDPGAESGVGGSGGTRTRAPRQGNAAVFGKYDSISICHSGNGRRYAALANVQVFITLAESGLQAELRGHDGHSEDIIPAFTYDLGDGVRSYPGQNWNAESRLLYANDCTLFIEQASQPSPEASVPPEPQPPVPPIIGDVPSCKTTTITTAPDDQTLVRATVPPEALKGRAQSDKAFIKIGNIPPQQASRLYVLFDSKIKRMLSELRRSQTVPPGLLKKRGTVPYEPPQQRQLFIPSTTTSEVVVVSSNVDCPEDETDDVPAVPPPDTDGDGLPDTSDSDDDNDGITDTEEPRPRTPDEDSDPDSIPDVTDSDPTRSEPATAEQEAEESTDVVIVSDELTEEDLQAVDPDGSSIIVPPFEVIAFDENGDPIDSFNEPVLIEIFSPKVEGFSESVFVFQPSEDGGTWFEVPAERVGDTLRFYLENPGTIVVALLPRAMAAEPGVVAPAGFVFPSIPSLPEPVQRAFEFGGLATGGFLMLWSFLRAPFSATNIWRMFAHGWHHLFELFTWRKRRRPWGTVYDSVTKAPVDPAYVELFDLDGTKQDEAITDLDGRYGFLVGAGSYRMQVRKTHYTFPSERRHISNSDIIYDNLYYGGAFDAAEAVARDIPMDPLEFDWNQYEKMRTRQTRFIHRFDPAIVLVFDIIFWIGAALMLWQFVTETSVLSALLLLVYLLLLYRRLTAGKPQLYGVIRKDGTLLPYAVIRVLQNDTQIAAKVSDAYGRYSILVPPGSYRLQIAERVSEDEFRETYEGTVRAKNGIINENISIT